MLFFEMDMSQSCLLIGPQLTKKHGDFSPNSFRPLSCEYLFSPLTIPMYNMAILLRLLTEK